MTWATRRKTARVEDVVYFLMDIFGISLEIVCGEAGSSRLSCRSPYSFMGYRDVWLGTELLKMTDRPRFATKLRVYHPLSISGGRFHFERKKCIYTIMPRQRLMRTPEFTFPKTNPARAEGSTTRVSEDNIIVTHAKRTIVVERVMKEPSFYYVVCPRSN
ncbi:hypothetical protein BDR05DRAFT_989758 [Suillus weaverae]|nr:hypothetical protein BDR05DRAFT_989758 [Suillus weaverae]